MVATTLARYGVTALCRAGAVLAGFTVTAGVAGVAWGAQDVVLSTARSQGGDPIVVEGSIDGVVAGGPSTPMRLTLRNPAGSGRTVHRVTARAADVEGPATCRPEHLVLGEWQGTVTVPAGGTAAVSLPVRLSADLPAECTDVVWGLVYTAY